MELEKLGMSAREMSKDKKLYLSASSTTVIQDKYIDVWLLSVRKWP